WGEDRPTSSRHHASHRTWGGRFIVRQNQLRSNGTAAGRASSPRAPKTTHRREFISRNGSESGRGGCVGNKMKRTNGWRNQGLRRPERIPDREMNRRRPLPG